MPIKHLFLQKLPAVFFIFVVYLNSASAGTTDLVKGFAQYQAGRVENMVLDRFIYDLATEKYLIQFFPETSSSIAEYDNISGKRLIPLLKYYVDKDLESLKELAACVKEKVWMPLKKVDDDKLIDGDAEVKAAFELLDWLIAFKTEENFSTRHYLGGTSCPRAKDKEVVDITKFKKPTLFEEVYQELVDGAKNLKGLKNKIKEKKENLGAGVREEIFPGTERSPETYEGFLRVSNDGDGANSDAGNDKVDTVVERVKNVVKSKIDYVARIDELLEAKIKQKETLWISSNTELAKGIDIKGFMAAIESIHRLSNSDTNGNSKLYAVYVHQISMALNALGLQVDDREGFQKFKTSSMFLASLAEAANDPNNGGPEAVKGVIDDFVNEDVAEKNKRNSVALFTRTLNEKNMRCSTLFFCKNTWFVGSYYGVSFGELDEKGNGEKQGVYRAFGPVGVEFKMYSGSLFGRDTTVTIMAAPIDIGVYVTDELKGDEYQVGIEDITSPSYFLSFSSKRSPMSFQLGYQKDIPVLNNLKEDMYFFSVAFDLPLFTLW